MMHVYFKCAAAVCSSLRKKLTDPEDKVNNFRDVVHLGETATTQEEQGCRGSESLFWKWDRGLIPDPLDGYRAPAPPDVYDWGSDDVDHVLSGWVATDGCVLNPDVDELSVGGFAAICWDPVKKCEAQSVFGSVPFARPASAHCEI